MAARPRPVVIWAHCGHIQSHPAYFPEQGMSHHLLRTYLRSRTFAGRPFVISLTGSSPPVHTLRECSGAVCPGLDTNPLMVGLQNHHVSIRSPMLRPFANWGSERVCPTGLLPACGAELPPQVTICLCRCHSQGFSPPRRFMCAPGWNQIVGWEHDTMEIEEGKLCLSCAFAGAESG